MEVDDDGLSIVILNYNTYNLTCDCLRSIYRSNIVRSELEIIVVDNGSTEVRAKEFNELFPDIIFIRSDVNLGFAKGNNLGIQAASKSFILLLNSDTVITDPDTFRLCRAKLKEYGDRVILTTKLLTRDGRPQVTYGWLPSLKYELIFTSFIYKLLSRRTRQQLLIDFVPDENRLIDNGYITATFFLFKKNLLREIPMGKLYDNVFLYGEELFWASQSITAGFNLYYFADVSIIHLVGASSSDTKEYIGRKTHQIKGEDLYLNWRYARWTVLSIYLLRVCRFLLLSPFDRDIRIKLQLLLKVLFKK